MTAILVLFAVIGLWTIAEAVIEHTQKRPRSESRGELSAADAARIDAFVGAFRAELRREINELSKSIHEQHDAQMQAIQQAYLAQIARRDKPAA
jgi:hypothetical protein